MRILFFAESLVCGGKERRILELMQYLKEQTDCTIALVITEPYIHYKYVYELGFPVIIIKRKRIKYDPLVFIKFFRYCRHFKPDIIHAWGRMTTFYAIPSKLIRKIPLVSSMIADALGDYKILSLSYLFFRTDIFFSDVILANSKAGLKAYKIDSPKAKVIWNGVHLERFKKEFNTKKIRKELGVITRFVLIMVADFSEFKDYDLFVDVAKEIGKIRHDVTFIGVGNGPDWIRIKQRIDKDQIKNVLLTGKQDEVEPIIAASDIGILCTYSEGISNSIIECMALAKPVISTDIIGGSKEIIVEGETGFCIERSIDKIVTAINLLLNNAGLRTSMGEKGIDRISSYFSINSMGKEFEIVYKEVLAQKRLNKKEVIKEGSK